MSMGRTVCILAVCSLSFLGPLGAVTSGCSIAKVYHQDDLQREFTRHHINLRWGRIPNAATSLHPDLQAGFVEDWEKVQSRLELKDIEVVDMFIHENQNEAVVKLQVSYLDKNTMAFKTYLTTEKWIYADDRWFVVQPAELPPGEATP